MSGHDHTTEPITEGRWPCCGKHLSGGATDKEKAFFDYLWSERIPPPVAEYEEGAQ